MSLRRSRPAFPPRDTRVPVVALSVLALRAGREGGAEEYTRSLTRALVDDRIDARVLVPAGVEGYDEGIRAHLVSRLRAGATTVGRGLAVLGGMVHRRPIKRFLDDIEVWHLPLGSATIPPPRGVGLVVSFPDLDHLMHPGMLGPAARRVRGATNAALGRAADVVIVPHRDVADLVLRELGADRGAVRVVPRAVDPQVFRPGGPGALAPETEDPDRLSCPVGSHVDVPALVEAVRRCRDTRPGLRLLLSGEPQPEGLHDLPAWVEVVPTADAATRARHYRGALALVYPTRGQTYAPYPAEAMACGCPVAASRTGGIPETVGPYAALFDPTVEGIAQDIATALDNRALWRRSGPQRARAFTPAVVADAYVEVYREVAYEQRRLRRVG